MKKILTGLVLVAATIAVFYFFIKGNPTAPEQESLVIKGSDTEVQLVSNLAEAFLQKYPGSDVSVTGGGSGVGIAAILNKEIDMANSSRKMKEEELTQAKDKNIDIQEFILAIDGLSIIVHPENTLESLTLDQISKIYKGEIKNWKDVGGQDQEITLYGRQSTSGTYVFFMDNIVKADYSADMKNMEGSQAIVEAVKTDKSGIGYVGVGYSKDENGQVREDIRVVSVAKEEGSVAVSPLDEEAVKNGEYPIARQIFQYISHVPAKNSLLEKYLLFEASPEGQEIVKKTGFFSLTESDIAQNQLLFDKIR